MAWNHRSNAMVSAAHSSGAGLTLEKDTPDGRVVQLVEKGRVVTVGM
jgi:hypothetical protein